MQLTITKPDDWHLHLRDGGALARTVTDASRQFARAIVMPNLQPPIVNVQQAKAYKQRILAAVPQNASFEPLMTLYLTDNTSREDIIEAKKSNSIKACKLYPAGATTNSASGVTDITKCYPIFEEMSQQGILLLVHGEVTSSDIDIFDREKVFIDKVLMPIYQNFPNLKIVLEHITTKDAVQFVEHCSDHVAATITAHHLLLNRNDLLVGGIKPHHYCLPILKRNTHQQALVDAACSGNKKFFLGTDSAPHTKTSKESACGCAGVYTAFSAIELYAEVFEEAKSLEKLEAFASFYGPDFYGLERNRRKITLGKKPWQMPKALNFSHETLIPLRAGETIQWQIVS